MLPFASHRYRGVLLRHSVVAVRVVGIPSYERFVHSGVFVGEGGLTALEF